LQREGSQACPLAFADLLAVHLPAAQGFGRRETLAGESFSASRPHTCPPYKTLAGGRLWQVGDRSVKNLLLDWLVMQKFRNILDSRGGD
jgi:hypothetical protein